jgi:hypothetical protein
MFVVCEGGLGTIKSIYRSSKNIQILIRKHGVFQIVVNRVLTAFAVGRYNFRKTKKTRTSKVQSADWL